MAITYSNVQVTKVLTLRGNTIQNDRYTGLPGELTVDTEAKTIRIHDGVTPGGNTVQGGGSASSYANANVKVYLTQFNGNIVPSANVTYTLGNITHQWRDLFVSNNTIYVGGVPLSIDATGNLTVNGNIIPTVGYVNAQVANVVVDLSSYALNANVTAANVGLKGYVDQANSIQSSAISSANIAIKGYIDQQITDLIGGAPSILDTLNEIAASINDDANVYTSLINSIATANTALKGYVDQANTIQSSQLTSANLGIIGYIDLANTIQSAQISAANIGIIGYIDRANTIQSGQVDAANLAITTANVGMRGYVDSQSFYSNAKVATYLTGFVGNIGNLNLSSPDGEVGVNYGTRFVLGNPFLQQGIQLYATNDGTAFISHRQQQAVGNLTVSSDGVNYGILNLRAEGSVNGEVRIVAPTGVSAGVWIQNIKYPNSDGTAGQILTTNGSGTLGWSIPYSNVQVATYLQSGNIANVSVAGNITATYFLGNGALLTGIVGGSGNYSNVDVANYLPTYAGTVSASLVNSSGNILSSGLSVFGNTRIGLTGAVSGQFHTIVGNITQTSSGGAVYINTTGNVLAASVVAGAVTTTGTMAVNSATGITTNQGTFLLANATATTINMGGAATTINLGTTASATGNVFVGGQIGSNAYNLTLRANGRYNTATSLNSNGGFNSPPYANQAVIGGTGTGMTANYSSTGGYIDSLTIYNSGTGYRNGDVISVPGGIAGNSFVLQNYSANRVGAFTATALYTFGIDGNLIVPGNVSATTFVGSGALLTSLPGYAYGNVNVAAYLNATGYNLYSNVNVAAYLSTQGITAYSNVQVATYLPTYSGNIANVRLGVSGVLTFADGTTMTTAASGGGSNYGNSNVASYLITSGYVNTNSAYANANVTSYLPTHTGNVGVNSLIGTTPNVTLVANSYSTTYDIYGNVAFGNALYPVQMYATGNISTSGYLFGNGAFLTGIVASGGGSNYSNVNVAAYLNTQGYNLYSNVNVAAYLNATGYNLYSNVNVAAYLSTATINTTGNITAGNLITGGAFYVANITTTGSSGNISGANYITANVILTNGGWGNISNVAFLTANTITTTGNVTVGGNLTITGTKNNVPVKSGGFVAQNTAVSIDSITAQWLNTGAASANQLSLAALNGNVSILYTYTFQDGTGGSTTGGSSSTTLANLSFGWTSIGNPSGVAGDMYNVLVTLPGTNAYRITAMTGSGYSNNVLTIERLV